MRIVVSGSHATGKSTLIGDFLDRHPDFAHWGDPFELEDDAWASPDAAGFASQLATSARRLQDASADADVIAERGPLDFVAYLRALHEVGRGEGGRARGLADRSAELTVAALDHVDLLVIVPIEHDDRIRLGVDDDPELRTAMNDALLDLIDEGDLVPATTRVVELTGDRETRAAALDAEMRAH